MSKIVLGKGLEALIPSENLQTKETAQLPTIALDRISPNPMQPRRDFGGDQLIKLSASLKTHGMLQPLVLRRNGSGYSIIAGERRFRAAQLARLTHVPAVIMDNVTDIRTLELALVENIHRQDLNPIELSEAYKRLIEQCNLTQQELSERIGRSRTAIANSLRLLSLPGPVRAMIIEEKITEGHARALLSLHSESAMIEMANRIVTANLSVRDVERQSRGVQRRRLIPRRRHPAIGEMETDLKRRLGTAVKIKPGLKRGRIEIEYYGDEDLNRLWELLRRVTAD